MSRNKGRIIQPPSLFIDHVVFDLDHDPGGHVSGGSFEASVGAEVPAGEYRVELEDGRSGTVRVTGFNTVSTQGRFEVVGGFN